MSRLTCASHIWLVHHLFVRSINAGANAWLATWNSHTLPARRGQQLYLYGMIQNGVQGVQVEDLDDIDPDIYGIDWTAQRLRNHHNADNPEAPVENGMILL